MSKKEITKKNNISSILNRDEDLKEKVKAYSDYEKVIMSINESDDIITKEVFDVLKKEIDNNQSTEFVECAKQVLKDHSKAMDKDLTYEQTQEILESEKEVLNRVKEEEENKQKKNEGIREQAIELEREKTEHNWNKLKMASLVLIGLVSGGIAGALGYKYIDKK